MDYEEMEATFLNDVFFGHGPSEVRLELAGKVRPILVDGPERAKEIIDRWGGKYNVYATFNELDEAKLPKPSGAVGDADVAKRLWFFVDIDPPKDEDGAPDTEAARAKAREVREYLVGELGWIEPYVASSGGGVHLYFACEEDMPTDQETRAAFEGALKSLSERFGPMVDTAVFNASRISRVPGPSNIKYDPPLETRVLQLGGHADSGLTLDEIKELHSLRSQPQEAAEHVFEAEGFSIEGWMEKQKAAGRVSWKKKGTWMGGPMYTMDCPGCGERDFHVGQHGEGWCYANCFHTGCEWYKKLGWRDWRTLVEPGWEPREPYHRTQQGNADRLFDEHKDEVCYVPELKAWMYWDKKHWLEDPADFAVRNIFRKSILPQLHKEIPPYPRGKTETEKKKWAAHFKWVMGCETNGHIAGVVKLLEPMLYQQLGGFNNHPGFLNCKNGLVNLRTGELLPHDPSRKITEYIDIDWDPNAYSEDLWKLLTEVMVDEQGNTDMEMLEYFLLAIGYTATGERSEEFMFMATGRGANGKTELLEEAIFTAMGSYAYTEDYAVLASSSRKNVRPGEATPHKTALRGKRLLLLTESDKNEQISEAEMKKLVSQKLIKGRDLYGKKYQAFVAEFVMWLLSNHKPPIRDTSGGSFRRLRLFPFVARFLPKEELKEEPSAKEREVGIGARIVRENPEAVLALIIRAAMCYYALGFRTTPRRALSEWKEYRSEEDDFQRFLDERCEVGKGKAAKLEDIFDEATSWCAEQGWQKAWKKTTVQRLLRDKGIYPDRTSSSRFWGGISIPGVTALLQLEETEEEAGAQ